MTDELRADLVEGPEFPLGWALKLRSPYTPEAGKTVMVALPNSIGSSGNGEPELPPGPLRD